MCELVALTQCCKLVNFLHLILYKITKNIAVQYNNRVATNLKNLEYSGISLNMENSGNYVQPQGKILANKVFLVHHSNINCVKCGGDLLYCWSLCGVTLDEGHFFAITYGNSPTLWPP